MIPKSWKITAILALVHAFTLTNTPTHAFETGTNLHLISFDVGSNLAVFPNQARGQGYELSDGTFKSFDRWYRTEIPEVRLDMLYAIRSDFGLILGFGSGQYGEKFQIDPSINIGFIQQADVGKNGTLSFRLSARLGGNLREKPCIADYGDIGGVQKVNCRLAATPLRPRDTLSFLWKEKPEDRLRASVNLVFRF